MKLLNYLFIIKFIAQSKIFKYNLFLKNITRNYTQSNQDVKMQLTDGVVGIGASVGCTSIKE